VQHQSLPGETGRATKHLSVMQSVPWQTLEAVPARYKHCIETTCWGGYLPKKLRVAHSFKKQLLFCVN